MKIDYYFGLDAAKHKVRVALCGRAERLLLEEDLPVSAAGRRELLALLGRDLFASLSSKEVPAGYRSVKQIMTLLRSTLRAKPQKTLSPSHLSL
jgi:hypothetical protein